MANQWQTYTEQLQQAEVEPAAQTELSLNSVLLMMARHLISTRRSHLQRQLAYSALPVAPTLSTAQAPSHDEFDK